jgi:hypothetical protein
MPSKTVDEIKDLLIRRNTCLYHYANGIRRYTEALRKVKDLENQLFSLSRNVENGESQFTATTNNIAVNYTIANCTRTNSARQNCARKNCTTTNYTITRFTITKTINRTTTNILTTKLNSW